MSLPDFMTNPNAVLGDKDDEWRYNRIPDYTKVNAAYDEGKCTYYQYRICINIFYRKNANSCGKFS